MFAAAAKHDVIQLEAAVGHFTIVKRSGNLNLRLVSKHNISHILSEFQAQIEKLGGEVANVSERFFTVTAHVSIGFATIEELMTQIVSQFPDSAWAYTNVFNNETGEPLMWWDDILTEK